MEDWRQYLLSMYWIAIKLIIEETYETSVNIRSHFHIFAVIVSHFLLLSFNFKHFLQQPACYHLGSNNNKIITEKSSVLELAV